MPLGSCIFLPVGTGTVAGPLFLAWGGLVILSGQCSGEDGRDHLWQVLERALCSALLVPCPVTWLDCVLGLPDMCHNAGDQEAPPGLPHGWGQPGSAPPFHQPEVIILHDLVSSVLLCVCLSVFNVSGR